MNNKAVPVLWDALAHNLPQFHWKAVVNPEGVIASCHHLEDEKSKKKVKQYLISNIGTATLWSKDSINPQFATASVSLTKVTTTTETTLRKITTATNKGIESVATQLNPTSITEVEELGESTIAHTTTECHTIFTQIALEMPVYNDKDLQKMKKAELSAICSKYNIKV